MNEEPAPEHRGYTLSAMIACVRRELALRKNVYPKWVTSGRHADALACALFANEYVRAARALTDMDAP